MLMGMVQIHRAWEQPDHWTIGELVARCGEEGMDGRFLQRLAPREHNELSCMELGSDGKAVVYKDGRPRIATLLFSRSAPQ